MSEKRKIIIVRKKQTFSNPNPIILIDSSYFSFYRFHATSSWWKRANPELQKDVDQAWVHNPEFMSKYLQKFQEHLEAIAKNLQVKVSDLIFIRDCPQASIWRREIFPSYKEHRTCSEAVQIDSGPGPVIKYSNEHILAQGPMSVIRVAKAEADDVIATIAEHHSRKEDTIRRVIVIANDTDFYQLLKYPNISIYKLGPKFSLKPLTLPDGVTATTQLQIKILSGDKTDGIPPIYSGCGKITAKRLALDQAKLQTKLDSCDEIRDRYHLNQTLIDFNNIPNNLREQIVTIYSNVVKHINNN